MPHVTVHFNPLLVPQEVITKLKRRLALITEHALSSVSTHPHHIPRKRNQLYTLGGSSVCYRPHYQDMIRTPRSEIFIRQQECHKTDVNPAPVEILVEAGRSKGRDGDKVADLIAA